MLSDVLDMLDQFEGIDPVTLEGSQYIRTLIPVEVDSAAEQAWCYLYNGNSNGLKVIASGNYLDR